MQSGSFGHIHGWHDIFGDYSPADQNSKSTCLVDSSSSTPPCLEFDAEAKLSASVSSSDYDLLYEGLERVEMACNKPKKRRSRTSRKSCRSGCTKNSAEKLGKNVCRRRHVSNSAGSFAGDSAAVCCCPCAILQLFILAFLVIPYVFARRAFCHVKRKVQGNKKLRHYQTNDDDEYGVDDGMGKSPYFAYPSSCRPSPRTSGALDRSLGSKFDTHKMWWELYAAGHMGFGGIPFERNRSP